MVTSTSDRQINLSFRFGMIFAVMILYFTTGLTGLIFEVVWSRLLTYYFGASIHAVSTVLAAFMGGLALGSYIFGRLADRWEEKSLKVYAFLALFVGISGLFVPALLQVTEPVFGFFYQNITGSFFILNLVRFVLCFLILLIPTTFMGGTLPLLSRFVTRHRDQIGLRVGGLYSINTLGAVFGCFLAGFYLIAFFGVMATIRLAAIVNICVSIAVLLLWRKARKIPKTPQKPDIKKGAPGQEDISSDYEYKTINIVLALYFISGFVAMSYQVGWWRGLVLNFQQFSNTTYAFTVMLTVLLLGLALGSHLMSRFIDRQPDPLRLFGLLQVLLGMTGLLSVIIIYFYSQNIVPFPQDFGTDYSWWSGVANIFANTGVTIFIPTMLMGALLPVVVRICIGGLKQLGLGVGRIYAIDSGGCVLGAFVAGFFLIPYLGLARAITLLAVTNVLLGFVSFVINPAMSRKKKGTFAFVCMLVAFTIFIYMPRNARLNVFSHEDTPLFYREGPLATVSVSKTRWGDKMVCVDAVEVGGTNKIMLTDQKSLAHLPMLLHQSAKNVLTVGFGSGGTSWSFTRYSGLEKIHCVEICRTVIEAAPYLKESNHGLIERGDPRFNIIIDDVRSYLRYTTEEYDIIATDCTDLRYKSNAQLYTYEYFKLLRKRLTSDGMAVVWMPLGGLHLEDFRVALRTFYEVFPEMSVWYLSNKPTHYVLLLGTKKPLVIDHDGMRAAISEPAVSADLAELHLDDIHKILSSYVVGPENIGEFIGDGMVNTNNISYLEFKLPRYTFIEKRGIDKARNLSALMKHRDDVFELIDDRTIDREQSQRLKRYTKAAPYIIRGNKNLWSGKPELAHFFWTKANTVCPEDRSIHHLLSYFDRMRRRSSP